MFKRTDSNAGTKDNTVNIKCQAFFKDTELLAKHFGCSRYVYNDAVALNNKLLEEENATLNYVALQNRLPVLKADEKTYFLKEVDSTSLQASLSDYSEGLKQAFKEKRGFPKFKHRGNKDSFKVVNTSNRIRLDETGSQIRLSKFGWVRIKPNQTLPEGNIQSVTVKKKASGKVYIVLTMRIKDSFEPLAKTGKSAGFDIGLMDFLIRDDGSKIPCPDFVDTDMQHIKKLQQNLSRKKKGSHNYVKARTKLARAYEKYNNRREDFQHKLSLNIVREFDFIAFEHLNVQKMLEEAKKTGKENPWLKDYYHKRNLMQSQMAWSAFVDKVRYKADRYGKIFIQVDTYYPSSQICSACGYRNSEVKNPQVREWTCPECGHSHDRDVNAAKNILAEGLRLCG